MQYNFNVPVHFFLANQIEFTIWSLLTRVLSWWSSENCFRFCIQWNLRFSFSIANYIFATWTGWFHFFLASSVFFFKLLWSVFVSA